jgi:hypothetical protein
MKKEWIHVKLKFPLKVGLAILQQLFRANKTSKTYYFVRVKILENYFTNTPYLSPDTLPSVKIFKMDFKISIRSDIFRMEISVFGKSQCSTTTAREYILSWKQ